MAKRSSINAIKLKQSGPYKSVPRTPGAIHAIPKIKSWPPVGAPSEAMKDKMAEKAMNPHGYSKKRNPICPRCYIQMSNVGCTNCV